MYHVDPDMLSFMVAILMSCVTAFISIVKKVIGKCKPVSKLWLTNEIAMCILAFMLALEMYPHISVVLPAFITKPVFLAICVHMSSRLIIMLEERASRAISS
mgnify:CR=1 FL=1